MSSSFKGLRVILDKDYDQDEKEKFITAIKMMKGVLDVQIIDAEVFNDSIIRSRTISTVIKEVNKVLLEIRRGNIELLG